MSEFPNLINGCDLLTGTSTGGIIALGLADGVGVKKLIDLYYNHGKDIFKRRLTFWGLCGCKYTNKGLKKLLNDMFLDKKLGDLSKKVLVPAFDLDNNDSKNRRWKPKFFDNIRADEPDNKQLIRDVCLYTSAAPTYFPTVDGYIDGGVCANNPSSAALAKVLDEEVMGRKIGQDNIKLLSIGTGRGIQYISDKDLKWGAVRWSSKIFNILFEGLIDIPDYLCGHALDGNYKRVNYQFPEGELPDLDDWKAVDHLMAAGEEVDLAPVVEWIKNVW